MNRKYWAGLATTLLLPLVVWGADVMLPFTFSAGGRVRAAELNANFEALRTEVNRLNREVLALQSSVDALRNSGATDGGLQGVQPTDGGLRLRVLTAQLTPPAMRGMPQTLSGAGLPGRNGPLAFPVCEGSVTQTATTIPGEWVPALWNRDVTDGGVAVWQVYSQFAAEATSCLVVVLE